jgi:hypothetical protein
MTLPFDPYDLEEEISILTDTLGNIELLSSQQVKIINKIFASCLPFHKTGGQIDSRLLNFVDLLTELTVQFTKRGNSGIELSLGNQIKQVAQNIPKPHFSLQELQTSREQLDLFRVIGLLNEAEKGHFELSDTFALFPVLITRLVYPSHLLPDILHKPDIDLSRMLHKPTPNDSLREQVLQQALEVSGRLTRHLVINCNASGGMDSNNIYETGKSMYCDEAESIFIFSRTPGIVIPTEYRGQSTEDKDSFFRRIYFDEGILNKSANRLHRHYQWNKTSTSIEIYRRYVDRQHIGQGEEYRREAAKLLSRFFAEPNMEISESNWDGEMGRLKPLLTLVNRSTNVRSSRDDYTKHIRSVTFLGGKYNNQYLIGLLNELGELIGGTVDSNWTYDTDEKLPTSKSSYPLSAAIKKIYNTDATIIKSIGEILDEKAAREIVDRLISAGEELERTSPAH